jgi:asparagine synthase (glutamine-hydrolysing)
MLDAIAHRGPDARATWQDGDTTLGHVRLAIQDVSDTANQPMEVDAVTLAYNGEAWNTDDLRAQFPNREWQTKSDTEPIAALIARDGPQALNLVDGMFALAWRQNGSTHLARDRYGKIPLYVARTRSGGYAFASELKALPHGQRAVAVEPGTSIDLTRGTVTQWAKQPEPLRCEPDTVRELLRQGVKQRLLSDRPVCFLLSGGLDSSLVLAFARDLHPNPVAYTAVFDKSSDDLIAARRIANHFDVPLVEVRVPDPTPQAVREAVWTVENPMKAQVEIALAHAPLMRRIADDGFRVALSGEAADELFIGYGNMAIASSRARSDNEYRAVISAAVDKMSRGNFSRVNKVMMAAGVEGRLPFMEDRLVALALNSTRDTNPPGKKVLKEAARGVLPEWAIKRQKQTFQGGTGIAAAAKTLSASPAKSYNAEARRAFGWLPRV